MAQFVTAVHTPESGKRANLDAHTVLVMNRELCDRDDWTEHDIEKRGKQLFELAKATWPLPARPPMPLTNAAQSVETESYVASANSESET